MSLAKSAINRKNFPTLKDLWQNLDELNKKKKEKVKGRGEWDVTIIFYRILSTVVGKNTYCH